MHQRIPIGPSPSPLAHSRIRGPEPRHCAAHFPTGGPVPRRFPLGRRRHGLQPTRFAWSPVPHSHFRRIHRPQEGLRFVLGGGHPGAFTRCWCVFVHVASDGQFPLRSRLHWRVVLPTWVDSGIAQSALSSLSCLFAVPFLEVVLGALTLFILSVNFTPLNWSDVVYEWRIRWRRHGFWARFTLDFSWCAHATEKGSPPVSPCPSSALPTLRPCLNSFWRSVGGVSATSRVAPRRSDHARQCTWKLALVTHFASSSADRPRCSATCAP